MIFSAGTSSSVDLIPFSSKGTLSLFTKFLVSVISSVCLGFIHQLFDSVFINLVVEIAVIF